MLKYRKSFMQKDKSMIELSSNSERLCSQKNNK